MWQTVYVEVKVQPISLGDIVRQIKFYRQYRDKAAKWVLAAVFPITPDLEKALRDSDITPLQLGQNFSDFVDKQRSLRGGTSTVKTI